MSEFSIRVVIADDHPAVLGGLEHELAAVSTIKLVGSCRSSTELIAALDAHPCDVVVSDYAMPGGDYGDGLSLFSFLQRRYPGVRLVVLTMMDSPGVIRSLLKQGISSILSKSDAMGHVIAAIHAAYARGSYVSPTVEMIVSNMELDRPGEFTELSAREAEVVRLFALGLSINEIAQRLKRSKQTVSTQKMAAMRKIGVTSDVDLLKYAIETRMVAFSTQQRS